MPWMTRKQVRSQPVQSYAERELQRLLAAFDQRMQRLNDEYLRRMGEHIRDIGTLWPSDVHRLQQIRRMNKNLQQIERRIAAAAEKGEREIAEVFQRIAEEDARMAAKILGVPDIGNVKDNLPLQRILQAQARETANRMHNLSNTTVVSRHYRKAIDEACTAVQSGVEDYNTAIRRVIREAGAHGLRVREDGSRAVDYESGWSRRLDSAARMNVLDGVRHLNQSIMEDVGRQFGADGVEIDAHMLCAEDHLPYQGQQFSNEEFEEIQDSLDRPFGEWNCRHSWHGIILGVSPPTWTPDQLEAMRRYSTEQITVDGRTKTRYQWSQEMRRCETAVRQQKDTANLARVTGDDTLRRRCQGNILELNRYYKELSEKVGLHPEFQRTYVAGFRDVAVEEKVAARTIFDADGNVMFSHSETPEIQKAQTFEDIAAYFHYEDKMGHLRPVLNDNMAEADLSILKEIAEGVRWARDVYGLSDTMPRTIQFGNLDRNIAGEYNLHTREITISREISLDQAFLTAVHEMTHFADDIKGGISERLLRQALSNLGVEYGSDEAISLQYGSVNSFEERIYKDPMEILAYSVEYELTHQTGKLGREMLRMWWEKWQDE